MGCCFSCIADGNQFHRLDMIRSQDFTEAANTSRVRRRAKKLLEYDTNLKHLEKCFIPSHEPIVNGYDGKMTANIPVYDQVITAIWQKDISLLETLLDSDEAVNLFPVHSEKGSRRKTNPVELACNLGYVNMVRLFLDKGCSPNLPTSQGRLLHSVLECLKSNIIILPEGRQLLQYMCLQGCDVKMKDKSHKTPLFYAAELGESAIINLLFQYGAADHLIKREVSNGCTPLHMAVMKTDLNCVYALLKHFPSSHIDISDHFGDSALTIGIKTMNANLQCLGRGGDTIKHAIRDKYDEYRSTSIVIMESLLHAGANPNHNEALMMLLILCQIDESICSWADHLTSITSLENGCSSKLKQPYKVSPYEGVLHLLLLHGAYANITKLQNWQMKNELSNGFHQLLMEIYSWAGNDKELEPKSLQHLSRQTIRLHLAVMQKLQCINDLPLPNTLKNYVKLNYL